MRIKDIAIFNPKGNKPEEYINYIDTSSVEDGKLHEVQTLSREIPSRAQRLIALNDILISSVRPNLRHNYFVNKEIPHGIASTGFIQIRVISSNVNPQFLYYFLTSEQKVLHYQTIAETSQSTFPSFNKDVIEGLDFPNVTLDDQQHIVDILGSIDEKIENNEQEIRKINDLALCFIAKSNNLNTELKPYIKFIKGKKPIENGSTTAPYLSIDAITSFRYESVYSDDMIMATPFDILMVMDGASSGTVFSHQAGVVSSTIAKIDCSDNIKDYLYWYLLSLKEIIKSRNTGSAIPHANKEYISSLKFDYGFATDIKTINILHSLRTRIIQLQEENKKLQELKGLYLKKFFE